MDNERWLTDGNCLKCRRAKYCKKDCKARTTHLHEIMRKAFMDIMEEKNPGYKEIMEKVNSLN